MGGSQSAEKRKQSEVYEEDEVVENPNHVELGDQNALRNIMDDAIVELCEDHKDYSVHYGWDNAKILVMVVASIIAAASHFFRTPVITERTLIYTCVIGFFAIHGVLLAYTVFVERDVLVRMSKKAEPSSTVVIKTSLPFTESSYTLEIQSEAKPSHTVKQELYVGKFFDAEGYFDKEKFVKQLETLLARFEKQKAQ